MPLLLLSSSSTPPPWVQFSNRVPLNTKFWNNNRPFKIVIWNTRLIFHALACVDKTERVNYVLKTQRHHDRFSIFSRVKTSNCDLKLGSITRIHHCLVIGNAAMSKKDCQTKLCNGKIILKLYIFIKNMNINMKISKVRSIS